MSECLDEIDYQLLALLHANGRATWAELGGRLSLSAPAVADRARRLEERGLIRGYTVRWDPAAYGYDLTAMITVSLAGPEYRASFLAFVQDHPDIIECHHVVGDADYWLKVRCRGVSGLERLLSEEIKEVPGLVRTRTVVALSTVKDQAAMPAAPPPAAARRERGTRR